MTLQIQQIRYLGHELLVAEAQRGAIEGAEGIVGIQIVVAELVEGQEKGMAEGGPVGDQEVHRDRIQVKTVLRPFFVGIELDIRGER